MGMSQSIPLQPAHLTKLSLRLIVINNMWPVIYQVASALIALMFLLVLFTFPETAFQRENGIFPEAHDPEKHGTDECITATQPPTPAPTKKSYLQGLRIFNGILTEESLTHMFFRPFGLIILPSVLWAALVQSVTIGFVVAVTSNVAVAYAGAYDFQAWQVGLAFIAAILGSTVGIPAGLSLIHI